MSPTGRVSYHFLYEHSVRERTLAEGLSVKGVTRKYLAATLPGSHSLASLRF